VKIENPHWCHFALHGCVVGMCVFWCVLLSPLLIPFWAIGRLAHALGFKVDRYLMD
jgi:hypothetical protein